MPEASPGPSAWFRLWPYLLLAIAPVLASWPTLIGFSNPIYLTSGLLVAGRPGLLPGVWNLDLNAGISTQALGHLAAEQWLGGEVPWWNPYTGIGMPLAGQMQGSALFLPFVLLLHFDNGPLLLKLALQALAGMSCFALLRALDLGRAAALVGGLMFGLCGIFAWLTHAPVMPVAFLPLFLLGIERARSGGYRLIAVSVALSILAGFPETAYLDGLLALVWFLWRLRGHERRGWFAARVMLGGAIGLALAAPGIWSFLHSLLHGSVENHAISSGLFDALPAPVPGSVIATWLFPALFGPILAFPDKAGRLAEATGFLGGYFGTLPVLLALVGLQQRRLRGLRMVLAGWVVLGIGGVAILPVLGHLLYAIPLMRQAIVARYAFVGWDMALVVLAALAVDDWRRADFAPFAVWIAAALMLVVAGGGLALGWPLVEAIRQEYAGYLRWPVGSVLWAVALAVGAIAVLARPATACRMGLLGGMVVAEAAIFFAMPLLSAPRDVAIDLPAVRFLAEHAGLQRFYTLGPYRPNYGAYFATPQLNHEVVPIPKGWSAHVRQALDPSAHPIMFRGDEPALPSDVPSHAAQLRRNLGNFEALGVRHVVTPAGADPFASSFASRDAGPDGTSRALFAGQSLEGGIAAGRVPDGRVVSVALSLGTYLGRADGDLVVSLCEAERCSEGRIALLGAQDNAMATAVLAEPLPVRAGAALRFGLRHEGGAQPVAIWLPPDDQAPRLVMGLAAAGPRPERVYRDALLDIYRLAGAAPYFESSCRLVVRDRRHVQADCDRAAPLVRRELFYPGWRATVSGTEAAITPEGDVMQAVALPQGRSEISFDYAPPYAGLCWALSALGVAGLIGFRRRPSA